MIKNCKKGDIFKIGNYGNFQFILVFAPHGWQLQGTWSRFRDKHLLLDGIDNPYRHLSTPTEFMDGRWIQFSESGQGVNGMDDAELEETFDKAFSWALENGIKSIITTGVRDIPFDQPEEPRVEFIKKICSRDKYNQLKITLISKDKSYIDGQPGSGSLLHFLAGLGVNCRRKVKIGEEGNESYYSDKINNAEIEPLKEFYVVGSPQPYQMQYMVSQMRETLHGLIAGNIPNDNDYTNDDLKKYCRSLVVERDNGNRPPMFGNWSTVQNVRDMPRELKDSCLFFPSIIAIATLSHILINCPEIALKTDGFQRALQRGFWSCFRNRILGTRLPDLYNDRYFTNDYFVEAIELLCKGGLLKVLNEYPDYSHEKMKIFLEELKVRLAMDLDCGYIKRTMSSDYADKCRFVLESLSKENA